MRPRREEQCGCHFGQAGVLLLGLLVEAQEKTCAPPAGRRGPLVLDLNVVSNHLVSQNSVLSYEYSSWLPGPVSPAPGGAMMHVNATDQAVRWNAGGVSKDFSLKTVNVLAPSMHVLGEQAHFPLEVQLHHLSNEGDQSVPLVLSLLFTEEDNAADPALLKWLQRHLIIDGKNLGDGTSDKPNSDEKPHADEKTSEKQGVDDHHHGEHASDKKNSDAKPDDRSSDKKTASERRMSDKGTPDDKLTHDGTNSDKTSVDKIAIEKKSNQKGSDDRRISDKRAPLSGMKANTTSDAKEYNNDAFLTQVPHDKRQRRLRQYKYDQRYDATRLLPRSQSTPALKYVAAAPLPPCSDQMHWFVVVAPLSASGGMIGKLTSRLQSAPSLEGVVPRVWDGSPEDSVILVPIQAGGELVHEEMFRGWSKTELKRRAFMFETQMAAGIFVLIGCTASIFVFPLKRFFRGAPPSMLVLLTGDRWFSILLRVIFRLQVYVFFGLVFLLPWFGHRMSNCYTGFPWEYHMIFYYYLLSMRFLELTLISIVGVNTSIGWLDTFKMYGITVFKQLTSLLACVDIYTDANFVLIAHACNWEWWVLALVTYIVGVLIFQSLAKWGIAMFFFARSCADEKQRLNECMAWCKLLHMETLVEYMGDMSVKVKREDLYQKPLILTVEKPEQLWGSEIKVVEDARMELQQMRTEVKMEDFDLIDVTNLFRDLKATQEKAKTVSQQQFSGPPKPQKPAEPAKPEAPARRAPTPPEKGSGLRSLLPKSKSTKEKEAQAWARYEREKKAYDDEFADFERRKEEYEKTIFPAFQDEMKAYNEEMDKHSKAEEEFNKKKAMFQAESNAFDSYKDETVRTRLTELEADHKLRLQMEDIKTKVNLGDSAVRCFCEDFFQAGLQIFFIATFKYSVMVLFSVGCSFGASVGNLVVACLDQRQNEQRSEKEKEEEEQRRLLDGSSPR